ncbi:uberolysin/carnocyclin family circular bacteriocin [Caldalkalibacillus mannanilyticus]|uniref:uberolysin/carnocyclin family circular bacteriocin n=1 Tax=Caldalkalibacillus mannanilyticus TaxID=1418 RepID=UPI000468AA55|nr:uberolysin/carnocyclin family circular bacteriocin [Caldalkalibacillus mannanilyticus]
METSKMRFVGVALLLVLGFILMAGSPTTYSDATYAAAPSQSEVADYSAVEMQLAQQINKLSSKTWNQSQTMASKIVNLIMNGHDVYTAISAVVGIVTFGWGFALITVAQLSLKWYIKRKGKKAAVTW